MKRRGFVSGREPLAYLAKWDGRQICIITRSAMAKLRALVIFVGLLFCAGCGNIEENTARQLVGRWQSATNLIEIDFGADGRYTMRNSGPSLTSHITNVPVELRSLHLMATEGA